MADIVDHLRRERSHLMNELSRDPRFVKLQKLDELIAAYTRAENTQKERKPPRERRQSVTPSGPSKRAQIEEAVRKFLTGKSSVHRAEILEFLRFQGLIGEDIKNPLARVAIYLSDMSGIKGDGQGNWRLVEAEDAGLPF